MKQVLVLCTGNSCRSIMAESLINALGNGHYQAYSAGSEPAGYVHPEALATLSRHGVQVHDPVSQSWDDYAEQSFDLVITVCDNAAVETCPAFPGGFERLHWSTPDPASVTGDEATVRAAFESAFAQLRERVTRELL
ncbi:MAG: arsenate reductase ArsC [Halioglobus sp.]